MYIHLTTVSRIVSLRYGVTGASCALMNNDRLVSNRFLDARIRLGKIGERRQTLASGVQGKGPRNSNIPPLARQAYANFFTGFRGKGEHQV